MSDGDARALEAWVVAAKDWSEAAQSLVAAAAALALVSRTLADQLHGDGPGFRGSAEARPHELAQDLQLLAKSVGDETEELRGRYLETAAGREVYQELLG